MIQIKPNYIEFKKKREIGEILSDTFKFFRGNVKVIFRVLLKTAGIPFILFIAASVYNTYSTLNSPIYDFTNPFGVFDAGTAIVGVFITYLMIFIYLSFLYSGMMALVDSYIKNQGTINEQEVADSIRNKTGRIIITGLIKYITLVIGWMLCAIPGIYLCAPLFLIFPIMYFEDKGGIDAFNDTFQMIKDQWFNTFVVLLVLAIVWFILGILLSLPASMYGIVKGFTMVQEGSLSDPNAFFDIGFVIFTALASAIQYILYVFVPVGAAFVYFNINENRNQTGTLEKINSIGNSDDSNDKFNRRF